MKLLLPSLILLLILPRIAQAQGKADPIPPNGWLSYQAALVKQSHSHMPAPAVEAQLATSLVDLRVTVSAEGKVVDAQVIKSIGYGCDEAAVAFVTTSPLAVGWTPAMKANGRPKKGKVTVRVPCRGTMEIVEMGSISISDDYDPQATYTEDRIFDVMDEPAVFPAGDNALYRYIEETKEYPAEALEKRLQGRVYVQFVVEADGRITNINVIRSDHEEFNAEAIRVVQSMPKWEPGRNYGRPEASQVIVPITFNPPSGQ